MTWTAKGYSGPASCEGLIDSLKGRTALVCGSGGTMREIFDQMRGWWLNPVVFAANDIGMYLPKVDHWVSYHAEKLALWSRIKQTDTAIPKRWVTHAGANKMADADYLWYGLEPTTFPLSGQLAMLLAYLMGCDKIILCGQPLDATPRFFDGVPREDFKYGAGTSGSDKAAREVIEREMKRLPDFKARVRSMSGWTREYFGGPDA